MTAVIVTDRADCQDPRVALLYKYDLVKLIERITNTKKVIFGRPVVRAGS